FGAGRQQAVEVVGRVVDRVLQLLNILVEDRGRGRFAEIVRSRVEVGPDRLQVLLVLRLRDGLRLAAAADEQDRACDDKERRTEHRGGEATPRPPGGGPLGGARPCPGAPRAPRRRDNPPLRPSRPLPLLAPHLPPPTP